MHINRRKNRSTDGEREMGRYTDRQRLKAETDFRRETHSSRNRGVLHEERKRATVRDR